jgi:hypothetical protein
MLAHRLLQLTFALVAHTAIINGRHEASTVTRRSVVLYQNDGNWTVGYLSYVPKDVYRLTIFNLDSRGNPELYPILQPCFAF